ncbi:MAG: hypothetical protein AABZ60_05000 [Planctomycetota bacterium]
MTKILFLCLTIFSFTTLIAQKAPPSQPDIETIAKKMSENMYNPMDNGLKGFSCEISVDMENPIPFSLTFSFALMKGKEPQIKIISVKPPEMQQFMGMVGDALKGDITKAFMGSFSEELRNKDNKVTVTEEDGYMVLTLEPKKTKAPPTKLWLKDYIVMKEQSKTSVPDPINKGKMRTVDNEMTFTWKELEKKRVSDKVTSGSEFGQNELTFEYELVEDFLFPKKMTNTSELGNLEFVFSKYSLTTK